MVAMNVETYARDVAEVQAGGWLLYDSSWPLPKHLHRSDVQFLGVPLAQLCNEAFAEPRERILMKNIAYAGVLVALLDIDMAVIDGLLEEKYGRKKALMDSNHKAIRLGYDYAIDNLSCPLPIRLQKMNADARRWAERQDPDRRQHRHRARLRVRRGHGGRLVPDHAGHVGDGRLQELLREVPQGSRDRQAATSASCRPRTSWRRSAW